METFARMHTSSWIIKTAVCLGFRTGGGVFMRTSQSFSLVFLISLVSFRNGSRLQTPAFKNNLPSKPTQHDILPKTNLLGSYMILTSLGLEAVINEMLFSGKGGWAEVEVQEIFCGWSVRMAWVMGCDRVGSGYGRSMCWQRCEWQLPIDSVSLNGEDWLACNVIIYPLDPLSCQSEEK